MPARSQEELSETPTKDRKYQIGQKYSKRPLAAIKKPEKNAHGHRLCSAEMENWQRSLSSETQHFGSLVQEYK